MKYLWRWFSYAKLLLLLSPFDHHNTGSFLHKHNHYPSEFILVHYTEHICGWILQVQNEFVPTKSLVFI